MLLLKDPLGMPIILILLGCLVISLHFMAMNVPYIFSVGELDVIFYLIGSFLERRNIGDVSNIGRHLVVSFCRRNWLVWCPRSYWRFADVSVLMIHISLDWRFPRWRVRKYIFIIDVGMLFTLLVHEDFVLIILFINAIQ